jgi:hypothetical protein
LRERCACSLFDITNKRLRNQLEALFEATAACMAENVPSQSATGAASSPNRRGLFGVLRRA